MRRRYVAHERGHYNDGPMNSALENNNARLTRQPNGVAKFHATGHERDTITHPHSTWKSDFGKSKNTPAETMHVVFH